VTPSGCILVVEDDADLRDALRECLENAGCRTAVAVDGLDALEHLRQFPRPCLILLDVNMPRLDGDAFVRALRDDERLCHIPLVSMSAGDRRLAPPVVQSHLEKPFELAQLTTIVERFCPRVNRAASRDERALQRTGAGGCASGEFAPCPEGAGLEAVPSREPAAAMHR
jgi:CheY-like chemotaxis protein